MTKHVFVLMIMIAVASLNAANANGAFSNQNGKIIQVENAQKATRMSPHCAVAAVCRDGAVLLSSCNGNNDDISSSSITAKPTRIIERVDGTQAIGDHFHYDMLSFDRGQFTVSLMGIPADCRLVLKFLREEAVSYRSRFGVTIPLIEISDRLSAFLHDLTLSHDTRPLAVEVILIGPTINNSDILDSTNSLRRSVPVPCSSGIARISLSGAYDLYKACCSIPSNRQEQDRLESLLASVELSDLSCAEAELTIKKFLAEQEDDHGNSRSSTSRQSTTGTITRTTSIVENTPGFLHSFVKTKKKMAV